MAEACRRGDAPSCAQIHKPALEGSGYPRYTGAAREHSINGTVVVECTLTAEGGLVLDCRLVQSVPELDESVLAFLSSAHYRTLTVFGRAVAVRYQFWFRFQVSWLR